jgi:replication factor C small subunit
VYRPEKIADYVFQNESHKDRFTKFIAEQSIPHLLLKGHRGTGKTTLAFILKNELGVADGDFKVLNASDDNSVDTIRNSVKGFSQTMPLGDFKIVFLDEADYLTPNAQAALRRMMEEYADTVRFILTCNKPHKIIDELKSRCQEFLFNEFDKGEMAVHAFEILKKEGVKNIEAEIIKAYVDESYPDMRKLLQNMEGNIIDGVLVESMDVDDTARLMVNVVEQLTKGKWLEVRENIIQNVEGGEWDDIYRFLYDNIDQVEGFDDIMNWKKAIIIIADHIRFNQQVADP